MWHQLDNLDSKEIVASEVLDFYLVITVDELPKEYWRLFTKVCEKIFYLYGELDGKRKYYSV